MVHSRQNGIWHPTYCRLDQRSDHIGIASGGTVESAIADGTESRNFCEPQLRSFRMHYRGRQNCLRFSDHG